MAAALAKRQNAQTAEAEGPCTDPACPACQPANTVSIKEALATLLAAGGVITHA